MTDISRLAAMNGDAAFDIAQSLGDPPPTPEFGALEEPLVALLLDHPHVIGDQVKYLKPELFHDYACKVVMGFIASTYEQHGVVPTRAIVCDALSKTLTIEDQEVMMLARHRKCDPRESVFVVDTLRNFIMGRMLDRLNGDELVEATGLGPLAVRDFANKVMAEVEAFVKGGDEREEYTFADLVAENPELHPPIIDGLAREGEIINVVSHSKIGKSWLAYGMALSVLAGRPWLGRFPTTPGKVLLIDYELHKATLAHRVPKVAAALGISPEVYAENLTVWPLRGNVQGLSQLQAKFDQIKPGEYKLIIIDPKYRLVAADPKADENDNTSDARLYNAMDQLAKQVKAAIVLIHHTSKGDQSDKRVTDVGSGAGAQSRAADDHLVLREHDETDCVVLDAAVRSFAPVAPVVLRWQFPLWTPDDDLDPEQLATKSGKDQRRRDEEAAELVRQALTTHGKLSVNAMRSITGMDAPRIGKGLKLLIGDVECETVQQGKRTIDYWQLKVG